MWLSGRQWVFLAVLDVFLRVSYFLVFYFFDPVVAYAAMLFSALHLVVLFFAVSLAVRFGQATFASIAVAMLITNVIYVGV